MLGKSAITGASLLALTLAIATSASAQAVGSTNDTSPPVRSDAATEEAVGDIVVTGSRVRRRDADSVGALLTLTSDDIARSGSVSVGELLQQLPSAGVSLNSNGTQGTSFGVSSINLRYLGGAEGSGNRVLVLVDSRRMVDAVGQRGFRDFVDLNTLPFGMIEGVEVLKDGASAIYGADAIAGVVNIKTLQPFDGLRAQARVGVTDKGDGAEYQAYLNVGKKWDTGSVVVSGSYYKSQPILTGARDLTAVSLVPLTAPGNNPNGLFVLPGLASNAYFGTPAGFATAATPAIFNGTPVGTGATADGSFRTAALPGDFYNTQAQGIYSTGPSERWGIYARIDQEIGSAVKLRVDALYNRRKSEQLFSPFLLDIGGRSGTVQGFAIAANQAFNPFGTANGVPAANALAFPATAAWRLRTVPTAVGNRINEQDVETWRIAGQLSAPFKLFAQDWTWTLFGSYAKNRADIASLNQINYDNLFVSLANPALCAATAGCVPVNLFSGLTDARASYIRSNSFDFNMTTLINAAADVTGTLFDLPAGPVGVAFGYEYRQNRGADFPDPAVNAASPFLPAGTPRTSNQTRSGTIGRYSLNEVYGELSIPVFKDRPFAQSLDFNVAGRFSDYSTVGSKFTLKVGGGYRPVRDVLFRGTYSQGFRAPSVLELYQGARQTNFQGVDPCNGGGGGRPGCAGVPTTYNQSQFNAGLLAGVIAGNINLRPETADTISAGVAITPRFLPGLSLTIDYYNIKIQDAIASPSATQVLNLCANNGGAFCALVTRDPASGAVISIAQTSANANSILTDGVDATLRYDFTSGIGRFGLVLDASYLSRFRTISPNPAGGATIVDDRAGKGDQPRSTYPRWKGQASVKWSLDPVAAIVRARYIGPTTDVVNTVKDSQTRSIIYTDAEISFNVAPSFRLSLGMNNVFDVQPPTSYANAPINYDIYAYDARGRFLYVRAGIKM